MYCIRGLRVFVVDASVHIIDSNRPNKYSPFHSSSNKASLLFGGHLATVTLNTKSYTSADRYESRTLIKFHLLLWIKCLFYRNISFKIVLGIIKIFIYFFPKIEYLTIIQFFILVYTCIYIVIIAIFQCFTHQPLF